MNLIDVYTRPDRHALLYKLLADRGREVNVSHTVMPSMDDHVKFVESHPYRTWLFIVDDETVIGACYLTNNNEIGIFLFREFQGKGYGKPALRLLLDTYEPLPAIPSIRNGNFIANINPKNERSKKLFESLGFNLLQLTYKIDEPVSGR